MGEQHFFQDIKEGATYFGENIGIIVNSILLSLVYFLGIGLTSIFAKIFRRKFLDKSLNRNANSYWSELNLKKLPLEAYYKQF